MPLVILSSFINYEFKLTVYIFR